MTWIGMLFSSLILVLIGTVQCDEFLNFCSPDNGTIRLGLISKNDKNDIFERGLEFTSQTKGLLLKLLKGKYGKSNQPQINPMIKHISILGERNSCSNAFEIFIQNNVDFGCRSDQIDGCVENRKWRHSFPTYHLDELSNETLYIHISRHPYEWIQSMRRNPFWANYHKNMSMLDFISLEWMSFNHTKCPDDLKTLWESSSKKPFFKAMEEAMDDFVYSNHASTESNPVCDSGFVGQIPFYPSELVMDRDPHTGKRFPTVMAMREAKLRDWLNFSQQLPFTHHVSCRDFMLDPDGVLDDLTSMFGFTRKAPGLIGGISFPCVFSFGKCVSRDVQAKKDVYLSGQYMGEFNDFVLSAINAWLDPNLEALFGYRLFGNVGNASVPYNSKTKCLVHGACQ